MTQLVPMPRNIVLDADRVRVFASDLDGTLFDGDHRLAPDTVFALRRARAAGIKVVAATGRAPLSAMDRLAEHDVVDALICSNGSIVHNVSTNERVHDFPIGTDHFAALFPTLDAAMPGLSYCWELRDRCGWDIEFDAVARAHDDLRSFDSEQRPADRAPATKVMVRHDVLVRQELADALRPHLPAPLTIGSSGVDFVEITGVGVNKATALEHVLAGWGVAQADVVTFGDNHNDVEMLEWAGHSVAVANGVDAAKSAADEVIGHHATHAVANYITDLLDRQTG